MDYLLTALFNPTVCVYCLVQPWSIYVCLCVCVRVCMCVCVCINVCVHQYKPYYLLHSNKTTESAHMMNGSPTFKGPYITCHHRIVNITAKELCGFRNECNIHQQDSGN